MDVDVLVCGGMPAGITPITGSDGFPFHGKLILTEWIRIGPVALSVSTLQHRFLASGGAIAFVNQYATLPEDAGRVQTELAACHGELDSFDAPRPTPCQT